MMKWYKTWCLRLMTAACIFAVDQGIKHVIRSMPLYTVFFRIQGIAELTHCTNTGAAFSIMREQSIWIAALSVLLIAALIAILCRNAHLPKESEFALSVLIGAGSGNLLDRIIFGGVTDYIRLLFIPFPVFNFADICITLSVMILLIDLLTGRLDTHPEEASHESDH